MIPELEALDALAEEIREAARAISRDWPQVFTEDELTARISVELIEMEGADDLASIEPRSNRMFLLLGIGKAIVTRETRDYEHFSGDTLSPFTPSKKAVS